MAKLSKEERGLLQSFEAGEWRSVGKKKSTIKRYQDYAQATMKKDRRVNIRLSSKVLNALQVRAIEEGIPYQTLIASVLHQYATGRLEKRKKAA